MGGGLHHTPLRMQLLRDPQIFMKDFCGMMKRSIEKMREFEETVNFILEGYSTYGGEEHPSVSSLLLNERSHDWLLHPPHTTHERERVIEHG